jgi:hypothetical protein
MHTCHCKSQQEMWKTGGMYESWSGCTGLRGLSCVCGAIGVMYDLYGVFSTACLPVPPDDFSRRSCLSRRLLARRRAGDSGPAPARTAPKG